jgi:capsular polysaccharide biosynthesis protein
MTENYKVAERWMFVGNVPMLLPESNLAKHLQLAVVLADPREPFIIKDIETVEVLEAVMKAMGGKVITHSEQMIKEAHEREALRGYLA